MTEQEQTTTTESEGTRGEFESTVCSRCLGSGNYSYNMYHGTRCFGCGGKGRALTKRGAAAMAYLTNLRSKKTSELVVGDKFKESGYFSGFATVQSVKKNVDGTYTIDTNKMTFANRNADKLVRVAQTNERLRATWDQAIAYQATLTKAGTPRKSQK